MHVSCWRCAQWISIWQAPPNEPAGTQQMHIQHANEKKREIRLRNRWVSNRISNDATPTFFSWQKKNQFDGSLTHNSKNSVEHYGSRRLINEKERWHNEIVCNNCTVRMHSQWNLKWKLVKWFNHSSRSRSNSQKNVPQIHKTGIWANFRSEIVR